MTSSGRGTEQGDLTIGEPPPAVPGHRIDQHIRADEHEWVLRTSLIERGFTSSGAAIEPALTRISKTVLLAGYERKIKASVFDGAPMDERLPWELRRILDGYRVRASLPLDLSLARVLSVGLAEGGRPYISRAWVDGIPLNTALAAIPALDPVLEQILALLAELHDRCVVVQDLKPDNLVLDSSARVWLIDIESLRAAPLGAIPCTHFTPRFAAPEQLRGRTSALASDIYAFGRLVHQISSQLPQTPSVERWLALSQRCLADEPLARPTAAELLSQSRSGVVSASLGQGRWQTPDETIRVPEPEESFVVSVISHPPQSRAALRNDTLPVPEPALGPISSPGSAAAPTLSLSPPAPPKVVTVLPAQRTRDTLTDLTPSVPPKPSSLVSAPSLPPPAEDTETLQVEVRSPRIRPVHVIAGLLSLVIVAATLYGGFLLERTVSARIESASISDRLVASARAGLREHKVIPEKNNDTELLRWLAVARQASLLDPDADALGVLALSTVWGQRWHRVGAVWEAGAFAEGEAIVRQALAAGRTPEGALAEGLLQAAACRLGPAPEVNGWCEAAIEPLDRAARSAPEWMALEARWGSVTVTNTTARRALQRGEMVAAAAEATRSLRQCRLAEPVLPAAPVNGPELVEDCAWAAGVARDREAWMRWSVRFASERAGKRGRIPPSVFEAMARSAAPECGRLSFARNPSPPVEQPGPSPSDGLISSLFRTAGAQDGSWPAWCSAMAERALRCATSPPQGADADCPRAKEGSLFDISWR